MSIKLRDLIKDVRSCKTAAEERALIQREKAAIRDSFSKENQEEFRPRNVAKLLFINMLGHDTDFGQMECLKLITTANFSEKRIGYLGLTQLYNEKSELLMMSTNRLRIDLTNTNHYVVSLALAALSEVCTAEMCRELASEVAKLIGSSAHYLKKKAILAATRIIRKVPEMTDEFMVKIENLSDEQHHGVLLSILAFIDDVITTKPLYKSRFKKFVPPLTKILKGLVTSFSSDYEVSGISDPFLQVEILKFFRNMAMFDQVMSDEIGDILAQVATNTSSNKNAGNAVLFECVKTIMAIESVNTLRVLGINILGKFLANKDANSKYVSLSSLQKVLKHDLSAVQKHKATILECLKENDLTIKKLALDLLYLITNESNVKSIAKEMLNYLLIAEPDFIQDLTWKICTSIEKYSPNRRWYIDTLLRVLTLAGNYVKDESLSSLIHLISSTAQLQTYSIHKIFFCLRENLNQDGLIKVGLWCIGEFGGLLTSGKAVGPDGSPIGVTDEEVVELVERVITKPSISDVCKEYAVTCLIKLYTKFPSQAKRITILIDSQTTSSSLEVQQRACEYLKLIEKEWDGNRNAILETMPICPVYANAFADKNIGEVDIDEVPSATNPSPTIPSAIPINTNTSPSPSSVTPNLLDLDDLLGGSAPTPPPAANQNPILALSDIFGGSTTQTQPQPPIYQPQPQIYQPQPQIYQPQPQVQPQNSNNLLDFMGEETGESVFKAFEDENLELMFTCTKEGGETVNIKSEFNNKSGNLVSELVFQVAVLKYLKLAMNPINSNRLNPNSRGEASQTMKIVNSMAGKKGIVMKIKLSYNCGGKNFNQEATISNFPSGF